MDRMDERGCRKMRLGWFWLPLLTLLLLSLLPRGTKSDLGYYLHRASAALAARLPSTTIEYGVTKEQFAGQRFYYRFLACTAVSTVLGILLLRSPTKTLVLLLASFPAFILGLSSMFAVSMLWSDIFSSSTPLLLYRCITYLTYAVVMAVLMVLLSVNWGELTRRDHSHKTGPAEEF